MPFVPRETLGGIRRWWWSPSRPLEALLLSSLPLPLPLLVLPPSSGWPCCCCFFSLARFLAPFGMAERDFDSKGGGAERKRSEGQAMGGGRDGEEL